MISVNTRQMEIEVSALYNSIEVIDQYGTSKYSDYECTREIELNCSQCIRSGVDDIEDGVDTAM